jgi:hypothetical protein
VENGSSDQSRIGDGRQADEGDPIGIVGNELLGDRQGQPRLADAGWTGEGQKAHVPPTEVVAQCRHLLDPANQGGDRRRQGRSDGGGVLFGSRKRATPAIDRGLQRFTIVVPELEGIREEVDRLPVRGAPRPALQVADRAHAQAGPLGQRFLGEADREPVVAEEDRERGVVHHAFLALS